MPARIAFQMDHIRSVDIDADSTFRIAMEAQARGHELYHYLPSDIFYDDGRVKAVASRLQVQSVPGNHFRLWDEAEIQLSNMDVVWLRQDPPFDMSYVTTTHLLDFVAREALIVNDPFWVRNFPEKLVVLNFPELIPPTVVARRRETLEKFRASHGDIVMKPIYGNGGAGVFRLRTNDQNFNSLCEMFFGINREPIIAQKYLKEVREGDKRIILVDGEPVGAINRVPPQGEARSNLHVGGKAEQVNLSDRDRQICEQIGPLLKEHGQIFTGIDVIGGMLTEINITSPTGIVELERFEGVNSARLIWEAIESRLD